MQHTMIDLWLLPATVYAIGIGTDYKYANKLIVIGSLYIAACQVFQQKPGMIGLVSERKMWT